MIAEFFQRQQTLQIHRQQIEHLFLLNMVQYFQLPLSIISTQPRLQIEIDLRPLRRLIQLARIQQLIKQCRMPGQVAGRPTAGREQPGQARQRCRIFGQKCQV